MTHIIQKELSDLVINAAFKVHSILGPGLQEILYKRAVILELNQQNIKTEKEKEYPVYYTNQRIGIYYADIVIENSIIIEVKSVKQLNYNMQAQLLNYLNISGIRVGYLCNFSPRVFEFKRMVL